MSIPEEVREWAEKALAAEIRISYGDPEPYNAFVAQGENVTAVSASGRVSVGTEDVKAASVKVSLGNTGEKDRFIEYIAGDTDGDMMYAVFKTGVNILREDGSVSPLCWVVTFIFRRQADGEWKIVHRHNTRSTP